MRNEETGYLRAGEAAAYLGLSKNYLAKSRMEPPLCDGPVFSRMGHVILYRRADLDAWVEAGRVDPADQAAQ